MAICRPSGSRLPIALVPDELDHAGCWIKDLLYVRNQLLSPHESEELNQKIEPVLAPNAIAYGANLTNEATDAERTALQNELHGLSPFLKAQARTRS